MDGELDGNMFHVKQEPMSAMSKSTRRLLGAVVSALLLTLPVLAADGQGGRQGGGPPGNGGGVKPGASAGQASRATAGPARAVAGPTQTQRGDGGQARSARRDGGQARAPRGDGGQARASRGDGDARMSARREGGNAEVQQRRMTRGEGDRGRRDGNEGRFRGTRYLYGGLPFYFYDGFYHGDCGWLRRRYEATGSLYWRQRFRQCRELN